MKNQGLQKKSKLLLNATVFSPAKRISGLRMCFLIFLLITSTMSLGCKASIGEGDVAWHRQVSDESEFFDMDRFRIHYIDIGKGRPVIMVHGFADSTYCWHENVKPLVNNGFRTILIDQPGLGRSDIPSEEYIFSVENQASAVMALADHLGLEHFDIVGVSMGGGICLYLALKYPEKIRKTIVIDPVCYNPPGHGLRSILSLPGMETMASIFSGNWAVKMALKDVYFDDAKVDHVLVDEYSRFLNKPHYSRVITSLLTQYFSDEFHNMTKSYETLKPELLIIWGENDKWIPLDFGKTLQKTLPDAQLKIISECGHVPHQEKPDEVNPIMIEFLKS